MESMQRRILEKIIPLTIIKLQRFIITKTFLRNSFQQFLWLKFFIFTEEKHFKTSRLVNPLCSLLWILFWTFQTSTSWKQFNKIIRSRKFFQFPSLPPSGRQIHSMADGIRSNCWITPEQLFISYLNGYWWQLIFFRMKCAIITTRSSDFCGHAAFRVFSSLLQTNNYQFGASQSEKW